MRFNQKILLLAALVFALLIAGASGLYFYSMSKLKNGLTYFHSQIVQGEGNVDSVDVTYDGIGLQFPFGLKSSNLQFDIWTTGSNQHVRITAESLSSQLKGITSGVLKVSGRGINLVSGNDEKPLLSNQFKIRNIEVSFVEYESYVSILNPDQSMRRVYGDLAQLIKLGDTNGRLNMKGTVYFDFGNDLIFPQRFFTEQNTGLTRIVLNLEDLRLVAPRFASRLSEGDLQLVANHPLKAPRLLEIRQETEEKARELRWGQRNFPEDVYRHVLWSYLLTKEYGQEFANLVTNSHEVGSFNTEEETAKDRQNNRVGIAYAEEGVAESKLLSRIRSDPRVQF